MIRWKRIWANALYGFTIGIASILTGDTLLQLNIPIWKIIVVALICGVVQGLTAFAQEFKKEVERIDPCNPRDTMLLF